MRLELSPNVGVELAGRVADGASDANLSELAVSHHAIKRPTGDAETRTRLGGRQEAARLLTRLHLNHHQGLLALMGRLSAASLPWWWLLRPTDLRTANGGYVQPNHATPTGGMHACSFAWRHGGGTTGGTSPTRNDRTPASARVQEEATTGIEPVYTALQAAA